MTNITTIEGIGPAYAGKLAQAGAKTCENLLELGATKAGRKQITEASAMSPALILKFVNHADLCRIKGVGGEYAELLEASGVDTVPELAQRNADNLATKMAEVNAEKNLVRLVPSASRVTEWVAQAKQLPRVITH
ncbi:MAG: DUF4332 domain-containing protein [Gammaproteobacteria bacterium]|nr:DUF4332 domain-containing protein [Gammaproteobacteria bacterium]